MTKPSPDNKNHQVLLNRIASLKQEHRELDLMVSEFANSPTASVFDTKRLKKKKLLLKDSIAKLESSLIPDLLA